MTAFFVASSISLWIVFVCHCGSNIAATVDVSKVAELALMEPGVVHAEDYQYFPRMQNRKGISKVILNSQDFQYLH